MNEFDARFAALAAEADQDAAALQDDRERAYDADVRAEGAYRLAQKRAGRTPTAAEVLQAGGLSPALLLPRTRRGELPDLRTVPASAL